MGLFDRKAKLDAAENEIMQKFSQLPILDLLIKNIMENEEEPWIREAQSFYDERERKVTIERDRFEISWIAEVPKEMADKDGDYKIITVKERVGCLSYSYTKSGYLPLHSYKYDNGKKEVSTERVCYLWACVVRESMAARMPECEFEEVTEGAVFRYKVPPLSFRDWF